MATNEAEILKWQIWHLYCNVCVICDDCAVFCIANKSSIPRLLCPGCVLTLCTVNNGGGSHTHTHTHTLGFHIEFSLSINKMIFILYILSLPLNLPITKKLSAFLHFQKNNNNNNNNKKHNFVWFISLIVLMWTTKNVPSRSKITDITTHTHLFNTDPATHTHTHTHTHTPLHLHNG